MKIKILGLAALALAIGIVYSGTLGAPFVYDDIINIVRNHTIRRLWPPVLITPRELAGYTIDGRPLLNFSFAINYAIGGLKPAGYHIFNIIVHFLASAVFFDLTRRTLSLERLKGVFGERAGITALAAALLFAVHPMATNAVTYISQRAESLAVLFYLLTLYFLVVGVEKKDGKSWLALSAAAMFLGTVTKEIVVTAPLAALIFDRTFLSGGFKAALKKRRVYYGALASSWILLFILMSMSGTRSGTVGVTGETGYLGNFAIQTTVVAKYLKLAFWPSPLSLSYAAIPVPQPVVFALYAVILAALGALGLWGLVKNRPAAFPAAMVFIFLAPTSSFIPINIQVAEYRMYLPLMCLSALAVCGISALAGKTEGKARLAGMALFALVFAAYATMATARNGDYKTAISIWQDAARKDPKDHAAANNLGIALMDDGQYAEAEKTFMEALEHNPGDIMLAVSLGNLYNKTGRPNEAGRVLDAVMTYEGKDKKKSHGPVALMAVEAGRLAEAEKYALLAIEAYPNSADGYGILAQVMLRRGRYREAVLLYGKAISQNPDEIAYYLNLGLARVLLGENDEGRKNFALALKMEENSTLALTGMANSYFFERNYGEAIRYYEKSLARDPAQPEAANFLAISRAALARGGR